MKRSRLFPIMIFSACLYAGAGVRASIIIDHQPHPYGGLGSDTLFPAPGGGQPVWQQVADDFVWPTAEPVTQVNFWGFYNADNPPATETMRLRFYESLQLDGLPGNVLKEVLIQNPSRVWTGGWIGVGIIPREYLYQVSLGAPVSLDAGTKYWLEVVQIGDLTTHFRWEYSINDANGMATANSIHADWQNTFPNIPGDTAFQLISPEPTSLAMLALGLVFTTWRRRSGKRGARVEEPGIGVIQQHEC